MNCPYCSFVFKLLAVNADNISDLAPIVCEACGEVALLENGTVRKIKADELEALKMSPAWRDMIGPVKAIIDARRA